MRLVVFGRSVAFIIVAGALVLGAPFARAQQTNPLDAVPDAMPFNIPYGPPISIEEAKEIIAAAEAEAKKRSWAVNIAVVDSGGSLVAFERMDGAQLASVEISQHKARAAARFRRETKVWESAVQKGATNALTLDGIIASRGGIPLVRDGKLIGAIGVSGATSSQDEVVSQAGAALINK